MKYAISYHKKNLAGNNIVGQFKELAFSPQVPIIELKKEAIYSEDISTEIHPQLKGIDFLIFASTHKSEKGEPSLCLHAPGNFRGANLGGQIGKVCPSSAFIFKYLFQQLNKNYEENKKTLDKEYKVTMEATHHGPLIDIPCLFIELGSNEEEWLDKKAAKIVAKTILSLEKYDPTKYKRMIPVIGIGGPHYAPSFNKIQLNSNYAISHILAQYVLPITEMMLTEAEQKSKEQIKEILVDWKGCGKSALRNKVIEVIEKSGLKYRRTRDVGK